MKNIGIPKVMRWVIAVIAAIIMCELVFLLIKGNSNAKVLPKLEVKHAQLVNSETGQPVVLRGVSLGWHNLWPRFYNAGCIKTLSKKWKAPVVRVAIGATDHALTDNPDAQHGYMKDHALAYQCAIDAIDGAIKAGCYVIVDWHSHTMEIDECCDFMGSIAKKYAGVSNVIYEIFNEPVSLEFEKNGTFGDLGNQEAMRDYWHWLKIYSAFVINRINENDPSRPLILMGCPSWDQRIDLVAEAPIYSYENLMYTVHFYAATHKKELRDACDEALAKKIPIFISECAACEASGDGEMDIVSWNEWTEWADANQISMLTWSVSDKDETCSMLTPEASSEGPWKNNVIKPWGKIVKKWLKGKKIKP